MKKQLQQILILIFSIVMIGGCGVHPTEMNSESTAGTDAVGDESAGTEGEEDQEGESTASVNVPESSEPRSKGDNEIKEEAVNSGEDLDPWGVELVREHLAAVYSWSYAAADPLGEMAQDPIVLEYKDTVDRLILSLPGIVEDDTVVSFASHISEEQFYAIDWEKYEFDSCDSTFIGSDVYLSGNVYLKNSSEQWKAECPAIFIQFLFVLRTQQLVIIEAVAAKTDIIDYNIYLHDEEGDSLELVTSSGTRMLDRAGGPALREELTPIPGLEGEELCRYIERIFLDLCRYPDNLDAYGQIFPEDTQALLGTMEIYYDKPYEIYDWAFANLYLDTSGDVIVVSQFPATAWNSFPEVGISFYYDYDRETGQVQVKKGSWEVFEKP